jgi:hypothetical protein
MLMVFDAHTVQAVAPIVLRRCSQWQRGEREGEARAHKKLLHESLVQRSGVTPA